MTLEARLQALSLEQKVRLLTGADAWTLHAEPAIGLRRIVTSDGPAGVRGERWDERDTSANVPSPTALAATWDPERIERLGRLLAFEARRKGVDVVLAPTVNLHRTPFGGRHFECFSEDPLLTAAIATAYVRGLQEGGVGATVKHFVAYDSETERFTLDAQLDDRTLRELYLAPFEDIVRDAEPWAVMAAYNAVNGHTMSESPLLRDVLKDEWGFDGVVMSDWFAARTTEGAGRAALDLAMPGPTSPWADGLVAAVREGRVPEAAVDDKVRRILRLAERVGALDGAEPPPDPEPWRDDEIAAELRGTAAASFVLVRNEAEVRPLDQRALHRVAVIGPNAAVARTLGGGSATVFAPYTVSPLEGLRAALGDDVEVVHARGVRSQTRIPLAERSMLRAPDGTEGGVRADFLDGAGTVLGSETRFGGTYTWDDPLADGVRAADLAAIEVRTTLRAQDSGEHVIGASALGRVRLTLDGAERFHERLALPPGADPVEGIMRPPQHGVRVSLDKGQEVELVVRLEPETGGDLAFGALGRALQLNVDRPYRGDEEELDRAAALAADADVAIVVVGTTEEVESEGFDRDSLALPGRQDDLVERVAQANPRTVAVVNAGAPVLLPWADHVPAIVLTWFGGQEFGNALADVLLGATEPGGRLPTTWPDSADGLPSPTPVDGVLTYDEGLAVGYRAGRGARLPFGHGLGYTTWEYLAIDADGLDVTVRLRNTGSRPGREVVQLYASREESAIKRPHQWLVGFAIAEAGSGEETTVTVEVDPRRLAHWDGERFAVEPGAFTITAARSSSDPRLSLQLAAPQDGG